MGRFAKLLLRLPGRNWMIFHRVWNYSFPGLIFVIRFRNIFSRFNIPHQILKYFLLSALRSIGLRCMEHLFFLRIVGEVIQTSYFHKKSKALIFSPKKQSVNPQSCFQGNTNAIDTHLFDLLEAGQEWTWICDITDKSDQRQFHCLWIARSIVNSENFHRPSLRTHACNESSCVKSAVGWKTMSNCEPWMILYATGAWNRTNRRGTKTYIVQIQTASLWERIYVKILSLQWGKFCTIMSEKINEQKKRNFT